MYALMRRLFLLFAVILPVIPAGYAADADFVRVWPQWRDAVAFERIGEYFGEPENTGRQVVLRTKPDVRDGYYFLVRVKHARALPNAKFALHVIAPARPEIQTFEFPARISATGETVFQLGLTGSDWAGGKSAQPVAWKLELRDTDGAVLAERKSFLWEKPAK